MRKQVRFWYDEIGWYAIVEHIIENTVYTVTDSLKMDFPVDLDEYGSDEPEGVDFVLSEHFPEYHIIKK